MTYQLEEIIMGKETHTQRSTATNDVQILHFHGTPFLNKDADESSSVVNETNFQFYFVSYHIFSFIPSWAKVDLLSFAPDKR